MELSAIDNVYMIKWSYSFARKRCVRKRYVERSVTGMKRTLGVCCAVHFLVDFACAFLLFRALRSEGQWTNLLIAYNFCAFAVQMPLGLLADRWQRDGVVALAGTLLVAAAYRLAEIPWLTVFAAGLGNAAFHVGAGLEVLAISENRAGPLGLFVSPGALGLFLGTAIGKSGAVPLLLLPILLLCAAFALFWTKTEQKERQSVGFPRFGDVGAPVLLLLTVVILRSYVGMSLAFPWKSASHWGVVLTISLALGKAAGGYLADRFGVEQTAIGSLLCSAGLLLLSETPACGVMAVFLFNMTMPLTLWACARLLPETRGFAFGILTFGLFLGFLPTAFGAGTLSGQTVALLALLSLALLIPALRKAVKG